MEEKQNNQLPSAPHVNDTNDLADILSGFIADNSEGTATKDSVQDLMSEDMQSLLTKIFEQTGLPTHTEESMSAARGTSTDARQAYFDAMNKFETARTAQEKEYWANIAAQYQSEAMRDSDRAYNSATSQVERMMAAGMSRQAALAAVQGSESQGQAAGVQSQAPTRLQEAANYAQQAIEMTGSFASTAMGIKQMAGLFPHQIRMAKSEADQQEIIAQNLKYEQDGRVAANKYALAAFSAAAAKAKREGKMFDPKTLPSNAYVKELMKDGYDNGVPSCKEFYDDGWDKVCDGNLYAQSMIQKGYDGWVSTKDYDPMEDTQPYLDTALKNEALKTLPDLLNEWQEFYKIQEEINLLQDEQELVGEQTITERLTQKQTEASTSLFWSQKRGQDILNRQAQAEYDLFSVSIAPAQAAECRALLEYWTQKNRPVLAKGYNSGDEPIETTYAGLQACDEIVQLRTVRYLNQERYFYLKDPAKWDKEHANSPAFVMMMHDYTGTLDAIGKQVGVNLTSEQVDLTEAQTSNVKMNTALAPVQATSNAFMSAGFGYSSFKQGMNTELRMGMMMQPRPQVGFH